MFTVEGFEKALQYWKMFEEGLICTIALSLCTVIIGFLLAMLLAVMRMSSFAPFKFLAPAPALNVSKGRKMILSTLNCISRFNPIKTIASIYIEIFRATPLLVQLFIVYFVLLEDLDLPSFKLFGFIRFERFIPGVIALSLNSAAYLSEIIRSGIQSIELGQTEASRSLGLSQFKTMRYIILPQAIKNILPAIANEFVTIIKESAICYTIGVQEIMSAVHSVRAATFRISEALIIAAAVYFCLTFPTSKIIAYFERRMSRGDRR